MYGRIYPIVGGFTASIKNATCGVGTSLDTFGDACPWYNTTVGGSNPFGLTIDTTTEGGSIAANLVFTDTSAANIRVLYMGPTIATGNITAAAYPMANAILLNNVPAQALTQITHGYVYLLAGNGSTGPSNTTGAPLLGSSANIQNGWTRIAAGPNGNFFVTDTSGTSDAVIMYDITTGTVRQFLKSATGVDIASVVITGVGTYTNYAYCPTLGMGDGTAQFSTTGAYSAATLSGSACFNGSGTGSSTQGVAVDSFNNLYLTDDEVDTSGNARSRIRKVLASQLLPTTMGTPTTQTLRIHGPAGTTASATAIAAAALNIPSSEITVATPLCATTADTGGTVDCLANVTFTPTAPGLRTSALVLTDSSLGISSVSPFNGASTGSALVADPTTLGTPLTANLLASATTPNPIGAAVDSNGDVFTMDTFAGKFTELAAGSILTQLPGTLPSSPTQITLDPSGNLWAAGSGSTLTELTLSPAGTYTAGNVSISGVTAPQAVAFDQKGNLYVADQTTASIYEVAAATIIGNTLPSTSGTMQSNLPLATIATGFTTPTNLAIDGNGNIYVADIGANSIFRIDAKTGAKTTFLPSVHPASVATDTAGNVYYQDTASKNILTYPFASITSGVAGSPLTVLTALTTPSGLAVSSNGNLYSADKGAGTLNLIARNSLTYNFGTTTGTTFAATVSNVGNLAATGYAEIDSAEFPITSGTTNGCGAVPSTSSTLAAGADCTLTSTFVPANGTVAVAGTTTFLAATSTTGALILSGTENSGVNPTTTASISGPTSTATYLASGTEISYTTTITASDASSVSGYVNITIDNGSAVHYNLTAGTSATVTVPISGLTVGSHTINVIYPTGQGNDLQSNTASQTFTITPASTTIAWTPSSTTQQYSSAIGASVLNAKATVVGSPTTAIPGYSIYTSTPTAGGTTTTLHAASFLAIGSYTLSVTFVPIDSLDYNSSTSTVTNYTVTTASTTAPVGVTQMLVAADNTGNYTSIQTALNALPNTGGSVYIKPGTYPGFVTVIKPNTAIRGLGGDPTQVVITNEQGAFSPPYLGTQTAGNNGTYGDEGSATLLVSTSTINGFSGNPNYFYAENFSVLNTWDTDSTNADTVYYLGGSTCTAGQPANNNLALYNAGELCGGQALAIWTTSDLQVMNNIYFASKQDTVFAGAQGGTPKNPGRQYYFRGKITGDVDYIFGDAAAVFDYTTIFSDIHGTAPNGVTIEAQNKSVQTGSTNDYLSGYIMNSDVITSQTTGMTGIAYGRPYGMYSTYLMLNTHVDQVGSGGWIEFSGNTNLPTSTYGQYNTLPYTDPTTGSPDLNGVTYIGVGGNTGQGVTAAMETTSQSPGTPMAGNTIKTAITAGQATLYYPNAFLGSTVNTSSTGVTNWVPTTALANDVNAFVPTGTSSTIVGGSSATILMRPQTPGLGAVTNGNYTIPTGTYTLTDSYKNLSNVTTSTTLASGSLDAAGEAYYTSNSLGAGTHTLSWSYSGDTNFSSSSTSTPFVLTVTAATSATTLSINTNPITYGQSAGVTATVSGAGVTPTGSVTLATDGTSTQSLSLTAGAASFTITGLTAGSHTFAATYSGDTNYISSTSTNASITVNRAALNLTATCANRLFDQQNSCSASASNYQYSDSATTVIASGPTATTATVPVSNAGVYSVTPSATLTAFGATNYTPNTVAGSFTVTGGVPQGILMMPLPNLVHGASYQLVARTTSGLPVTYTVTTGGGIASISGDTLTITGTGTVTITAAQTGNSNYAAATAVSTTFTAQ